MSVYNTGLTVVLLKRHLIVSFIVLMAFNAEQ